MTDAERIENDIAIVRKGRNEVTWYEEKAKEYREALDRILDIARGYATALKSGDVPGEKEVKEKYTGISSGYLNEENTFNIGFNTGRSLMLAQIVKRDMELASTQEKVKELEEVIKKKDWELSEMKDECNLLYCDKAKLKAIAERAEDVEGIKEALPDMLADAQIEAIPNSAIYDIDVNKLAQAVSKWLEEGR